MERRHLNSLLEPTAYPEPTARVRLIETHVSFIFITDNFVYKVKKPVDYGFLNFTTLDRRRFYCEEEVRLNRRLCPDIYLGVVELHETPEGASFAAAGSLLDYAVKMKRLPEELMLESLLSRGELGEEQMALLGRYVADFHGRARRAPEIDACGSVEAIAGNWAENFRQVTPFLGETLSPSDLAVIRNWAEGFLAANGELFRARVAGGFIRECDGDLHMGNICLTDRICIFDCIEFNERFRYTDTAADIAFLLMDLEYAGHPELSSHFLDAYLEATGDRGLLPLLGFYKGYRAFIRGKVKSFRLHEPGVPPGELPGVKDEATRYFRLARGYALREGLPPSLIITCGLMGSGKSTLAAALSFELGLPLERSDAVRKGLPGVEGAEKGSGGYHEGIYAPSFNETTYELLLQKARSALSGGGGIVVDATFRRRADRERFSRLAREMGARFVVIELRCPEELIRERLEKRLHDPAEISDGRWEIYPQQLAEYQPPAQGESVVVESALPLPAEVDQALSGMGLLP